jgi:hypothetical protein
MKFETRDTRHETRSDSFLRVPRLASRVSILAAAVAISGCGSIEPWVKPYERAALADPVMSASRDPIADEYLHHVYEVREGARGASGSAGGGCGCN